MSQRASLVDYAMHIARAGTSAALALAIGTAHDAANRIGFYADTSAGAEKVAMLVGAQVGPIWTRSGTDVNEAISGALSITKQITSTLPTGTAPFVVASTTVVANLNVSQLLGSTWAAPGTIGSGTPSTGAFTTISATGAITSTLVTGTAPFTVASTTQVANLYASRAALADTVTTNASLTGPITSVGNATSVAAQTGTGTTFVMQASPTLTTPNIGAATATSLTSGNITNSALTSGRVPVAGTAGLMGDFSTLTYASGTGLVADQLTSSGLTSGRITTAGTAGKLQDFAGLAIVGTPSATAPNTGTAGPGTVSGHVLNWDGTSSNYVTATFGNGSAVVGGLIGFACQGTAASPGATASGDSLLMQLRGHDGINFTAGRARIEMVADGTWTPTSQPAYLQFRTTTTNTSIAVAGRVDQFQALVWGGGFNSVGTFSAGTQRPHIQTAGTAASTANIVQSAWIAGAGGPTGIFAKSRSATVGTQGVITTGDTLGTLSWQGDDGANFIEGARIVGKSTGTIGAGQVSARLTFDTMNAAATMKTALTLTELQSVVCGNAALATNATDGFFYMPTCAGTPTGVPTTFTGRVAHVYDTTNNKLYVYNGAAWKATAALT